MNLTEKNTPENDGMVDSVSGIVKGEVCEKLNNTPKYLPVSILNALEIIDDLIVLINNNLQIEYVNDQIYRVSGYLVEEVIGKNVSDFLDEKEKERLSAIWNKIGPEKQKFSFLRFSILNKGFDEIIVECNGVPVKNEAGELAGYFCILRNITERENAEMQLQVLVKELKENISIKDKFFSIVAHDLKSPFHGLLGLSKVVLQEHKTLTPDDLAKYLSNMHKSAKNVYGLVENLLEWARIQTNRIEFAPENLNLFDEVQKSVKILSENLASKNIKAFVNIDQRVMVNADQRMLQSILMGLINNSIKFTPAEGFIAINSVSQGNYEVIKVIDNGIGISEENLSKLFRLDVHFSTLGTSKEVGTGLGLLLCKEHVELNGGRIWVDSKVDYGSVFAFTLRKI